MGVLIFIIFIMCLFIVVVIQAMGRVVALGVASYGYVAVITVAVTVPVRRHGPFVFTQCQRSGKKRDAVHKKIHTGDSRHRPVPFCTRARDTRL